ncbi:hypothetical protein ABW19_dt0208148 [Dactylella cylindrospora]|nr:hypothetical protein ABW19_dt0208148 [Dactylella cylindrospora]
MSNRPSSPIQRPRSPPRPRSPTTSTFQIRGLPSFSTAHEAGFVTISGSEYDRLVREHPEAVLCYIDEDDEEVIRVGSGAELRERYLEVMGFPPPPPPIIFNVEGGPTGLSHWRAIFEKSQPSTPSPTPAPRVEEPKQSPRSVTVVDESDEDESLYAAPIQKPAVPEVPPTEAVVEEPKATQSVDDKADEQPTPRLAPSLPIDFAQEPFVASFEAEINRIYDEVVSQAGGSPRCLSPRPLSPRPQDILSEQPSPPEVDEDENQRNPVELISDVFKTVIQSIQRVAQEATSQAARAFPQAEETEGTSPTESLDAFNTAVQQLLKNFTEQLHALATEAVQSASNPQANPQHPAAVLRTFAESVGHAAVQNAGRIKDEIHHRGSDASIEARKAAEEIKKAAEEVKKAAQLVTREVGRKGMVVGKVAGGAGREVGKVFSDGAGIVTGFAGGLVRNLSGQSQSSNAENAPEVVEEPRSEVGDEKSLVDPEDKNLPPAQVEPPLPGSFPVSPLFSVPPMPGCQMPRLPPPPPLHGHPIPPPPPPHENPIPPPPPPHGIPMAHPPHLPGHPMPPPPPHHGKHMPPPPPPHHGPPMPPPPPNCFPSHPPPPPGFTHPPPPPMIPHPPHPLPIPYHPIDLHFHHPPAHPPTYPRVWYGPASTGSTTNGMWTGLGRNYKDGTYFPLSTDVDSIKLPETIPPTAPTGYFTSIVTSNGTLGSGSATEKKSPEVESSESSSSDSDGDYRPRKALNGIRGLRAAGRSRRRRRSQENGHDSDSLSSVGGPFQYSRSLKTQRPIDSPFENPWLPSSKPTENKPFGLPNDFKPLPPRRPFHGFPHQFPPPPPQFFPPLPSMPIGPPEPAPEPGNSLPPIASVVPGLPQRRTRDLNRRHSSYFPYTAIASDSESEDDWKDTKEKMDPAPESANKGKGKLVDLESSVSTIATKSPVLEPIKDTVPQFHYPGLRRSRTTTDSFGRNQPWLAPWQRGRAVEPVDQASSEAMKRFPSLSELQRDWAAPSPPVPEKPSSSKSSPFDDLAALASALPTVYSPAPPPKINPTPLNPFTSEQPSASSANLPGSWPFPPAPTAPLVDTSDISSTTTVEHPRPNSRNPFLTHPVDTTFTPPINYNFPPLPSGNLHRATSMSSFGHRSRQSSTSTVRFSQPVFPRRSHTVLESSTRNRPSSPFNSMPGHFPEEPAPQPPPRPLSQQTSQSAIDDALARERERMRLIEEVEESVRRSSEEFDEQQRINALAANNVADNVRTVRFDDDPIEKCVTTLIEMGYTEMGTDRLRVFAELSGGRVEDAVEMVEEERDIWQTFTS